MHTTFRKRLIRTLAAVAVLAAAAVAVRIAASRRSLTQVTREFHSLGTYGRMTLWADDGARLEAFLETALAQLQEFHDRVNIFDPNSELSRLNRSAYEEPFGCTPELWDILLEGRRAHELTDGMFDVTIGPLMALWGFHRERQTYPRHDEIQAAAAAVGLHKVTFDDALRTVRFTHPETYLDLGGIAKGYALDMLAAVAREFGVTRGVIDLGGDVYCLPQPPPGKQVYRVGIRDPYGNAAVADVVEILGMAVTTSGNYENFVELDGRLVHHLINPHTGYPAPGVASVTVVARSGTLSDVFSTAIFVAGPNLAESFVADHSTNAVLTIMDKESGTRRRLYNWPPPTAPSPGPQQ